jgi:tRNA A37 threonylcarbamoyladenosine modification protein TsaB
MLPACGHSFAAIKLNYMKRKIALAVVVTAALVWNLQLPAAPSSKVPFDEELEKKAVLAAIDAETNSFYRRDYESWKKHYIHTSYAFQGWNNADGSFDARSGWNEVDQKISKHMKEHPVPAGMASHPRVEKRNLVVKFYGSNVAYLVWDQYNSDMAESNTSIVRKCASWKRSWANGKS